MKKISHSTQLLLAIIFLIPYFLTAQQSAQEDSVNVAGKILSDSIDRSYFTNTTVVNQFGEEMNFFDNLLKDKVVVINSFYSQCTTDCPLIHDRLQKIQDHLGDRLGRDVNLISLTVDPENDTPEVLKVHADQYGAKRGWYFISGDKEKVATVLMKLGKYVSSREGHDNIFVIGNLPTRLWKKANGLANEEELIRVVDSVINDEG